MNSILATISVGDIVTIKDNVVIPSDYSAEDLEFISKYCDVIYEVVFLAPVYNAPVGYLLNDNKVTAVLRNSVYVTSLPEIDEDSEDEPEALREELEETLELRADSLSGRTFMVYLSDIDSVYEQEEFDIDEDEDDDNLEDD